MENGDGVYMAWLLVYLDAMIEVELLDGIFVRESVDGMNAWHPVRASTVIDVAWIFMFVG